MSVQVTSAVTNTSAAAPGSGHARGGETTSTVTVREPRDGVHDSLWRVAQRALGDGDRWPEIYRLNVGRPQPDGASLTSPSLVRPGWILVLPQPNPSTAALRPTIKPAPDDHPARMPTVSAQPTSTPATRTAPTSSPAPSRAATTPSAVNPVRLRPGKNVNRDPGIDIGDGVFVSLGLATAIGGALSAARRRNRRCYIPGSGRRDDLLPVAPVIRSLHLAQLRDSDESMATEFGDDSDTEAHRDSTSLPDSVEIASAEITSAESDPSPGEHAVDVLALGGVRGVGLIGPGSAGAARAVLLDALTAGTETGGHNTDVLVSAAVAVNLIGAGEMLPAGLHLVDSLDAALDQLDAALVHRAYLNTDANGTGHDEHRRPIVLITEAPTQPGRLQAVLEAGTKLGLTGVVLGQWRAGTSCYLEHHGTITATNHPNPETLLGRRAFTITASAAVDVLNVLATRVAADPEPDEQSTGSSTPPSTDLSTPSSAAASPELEPDHRIGIAPGATPSDEVANDFLPLREAGTPAAAAAASLPVKDIRRRPDRGLPAIPRAGTVRLNVLGTPHLTWQSPRGDVVDLAPRLGARQRELIVLLALHRDGLERGRVAETLWPGSPPDRPFNALHTTLSRMRRTIASTDAPADLIVNRGDRYLIDSDVVDVDSWAFDTALAARRAASSSEQRATACRQVVACYQGELAAGLDSDWIDAPREAARRDALDAATELARSVVDTDPQQALDLLEMACTFDPLNEQIYCSIMRTQRRLGRLDAIGRTMALLTVRLAEIGESPARETSTLAETLQLRPTSPAVAANR